MTHYQALVAEFENAAGHHYIHSSMETLARLEKARAALLAWDDDDSGDPVKPEPVVPGVAA